MTTAMATTTTTMTVETVALTAAEWAERWDVHEETALELLRSMRPGTVERHGDAWTLAPSFVARFGHALGALNLGGGDDERDDFARGVGGRGSLEDAQERPSRPARSRRGTVRETQIRKRGCV